MIRIGTLWIVLAVATLASGCATTRWEHFAAPSRIESPDKGFTVQVPAGWRRAPGATGDRVVLTADGIGIQYLEMARLPLEKAFVQTKAKTAPGLSPRELGELVLAELRAIGKTSHIELKSAGEARIDGRPAFLLHLAERTEGGAQYERIVAGVQGDSNMLWAHCRALARYFFERVRPVCEQAISSMRVAGL